MKKILLLIAATVACLALSAEAAVQVGAGGAGPVTFDVVPLVGDWASRSIPGAGGDINTAAQMDTAIQTNTAAQMNAAIVEEANPPPATATGNARWNSVALYLQTRPTGNAATLIKATLTNTTGLAIHSMTITYDMVSTSTNVPPNPEQLAAFRVYYNRGGASNSWVVIEGLSHQPAGTISTNVVFDAPLTVNGQLFLVWADDNANPGTDGSYSVDNFTVSSVVTTNEPVGITITSPTAGQNIVAGANFAVNATTTGVITDTGFYLDGGLVGSDTTTPYSVIYSNVAVGPHTLTAVANGSVTSAPVMITIVANNPPSVALTKNPAGNVLVGSNVVITATVTDADPGGSVGRVEFFLEGVLKVTDTTSPYTYELCDTLVGTHNVSAIAYDQSASASAPGTTTVTATNRPDVAILIPNGSLWKYLDDGSDQGTLWTGMAFIDAGWSNGVAEIGFGDIAQNRPETTLVNRTNLTTTNITFYFRKTITVADPTPYTNLIIRLLRDDGGIVYINGNEVFRSAVTNVGPITYQTTTGTAVGDDGSFYQGTNISNVLTPGPNVIAVEIHQDAIGSSDISFDLMLWAQPGGPSLTITILNPTQADVSWPFPSTGYALESKADLNAAWAPAPEAVNDIPDLNNHHVTVNINAGNKFFRLSHP